MASNFRFGLRLFGFGAVAVAALFFGTRSLRAQWQQAPGPPLPHPSQHIGALRASGRFAWAGTWGLYRSTDTGATWQPVTSFPTSFGITDIAVCDSAHVFVGTWGSGTFYTTDAGATWFNDFPDYTNTQTIYNQVAFNGSDSNLIALDYSTTAIFFSTDAGVTWRESIPTSAFATGSLCLGIARDKTLYVLSYTGNEGWINRSTDGGQTWSSNSTNTDGDSNTLSVDSCDANRLYVVNENTVARSDGMTRVDLTTDAGLSWQAAGTVPLDYYNGAMASRTNVLYLGTVPNGGNGVLRSTDRGATWQSIGGPSEEFDTRTIAAVTNNVVLVMDSASRLWRTVNSGGQPVRLPEGAAIALSIPSTRISFQESGCGAPAAAAVALQLNGCGTPSGALDSAWVTGSSAFLISDSRSLPRTLEATDSIAIEYSSTHSNDSAELHLRYDLGTGARDTTIELVGRSSPLTSKPAELHRASASAYAGALASLPLSVDLDPSFNVDSLWPSITRIEGTYTWDSTVAVFSSYSPPAGWSLSALNAGSDSASFAIQKLSGALATSPLALGTAMFEPVNSLLATTWVELPRFVIFINGEPQGLCVSENEDSHWDIKNLGEASGVAEIPTAPNRLALYPNPATGNVWLSSSADLGRVTITVFDMLGTPRSMSITNMVQDVPISLALPEAAGVYAVAVRTGEGCYNLRVIRQ